eukprot:7817085-Pyramimonas_sp.AAC.1
MPSEFRVLTDRADEPAVTLLLERGLWEVTQVPAGWRPPSYSHIVWRSHDGPGVIQASEAFID